MRILLVLFGTLCVMVGCRGSEPEHATEHSDADTTTGVVEDSSSQDTTDAESDSVERPGPGQPGPAPGTVRVRATVASCDTTGSPTHCRFRIEEVLAYGSSTPVIGRGERTVRVSEALLSGRTVDDLTNAAHVYVLHHAGDRPRMRDEEERDERIEWTARSIDPE